MQHGLALPGAPGESDHEAGLLPRSDDEADQTSDVQGLKKFIRLASAVAVMVAACVLFFRSSRMVSTMSSNDVVGFGAVQFEDKGWGKCTLADGSDPKHDWKGRGDVRAMCEQNDECVAYSASDYGGGLLWLEGPVQGGGPSWGGCHCNIKVKATSASKASEEAPLPDEALNLFGEEDQSSLPDNAVNGDAVPFPNIHLATLGYNIFYGDPLPVWPEDATPDVKKVAMDPGLKKPLFLIEYTKERFSGDRRHTNPDGFHATVDQGCSQIFTTKTIRDQSEYATDQSQTVSAYARAELALTFPEPGKLSKKMKGVTVGVKGKLFTRVGGTLSYQWRDIQKANRLVNQKLYKTSAKCVTHVVALSFADPPKTHPEFQDDVDGASSETDFFKLFDEFGTHMLTTVKFGARYGTSIFMDEAQFEDARKTANGIGLSVFASVGAVAKLGVSYKKLDVGVKKVVQKMATLPLLTPQEKDAGRTFGDKYVKHMTKAIVGPPMPAEGGSLAWQVMVEENPVPIGFDQEPICSHPAIAQDTKKYETCVNAMNAYCEKWLKPRGATCGVATKECYNDMECDKKPHQVCRNSKCVPAPQCVTSAFKNTGYSGAEYQLPIVTAKEFPDGLMVDLRNGDFADSISSFKMSDGCMRAELIDDDGSCVLGKRDNLKTSSSRSSLVSDLDNDVCKVKLWAKPPPAQGPEVGQVGWIDVKNMVPSQSSNAGSAGAVIDLDASPKYHDGGCSHTNSENRPWWKATLGGTYNVKAVKITNRGDCCSERFRNAEIWVGSKQCASNINLGSGQTREIRCVATGSDVKVQLAGHGILTICELAVLAEKSENRRLSETPEELAVLAEKPENRRLSETPEDDVWHTLNASALKLEWARKAASQVASRQELGKATARDGKRAVDRRLDSASYLKNIGKAMYGFNINYAAPASADFAGSDPGFRHRPVWAVSYASGQTSSSVTLKKIPRNVGTPEETPFELFTCMSLDGGRTQESGFTSLKAAQDRCRGLSSCMGITCERERINIRNNQEKVDELIKCELRTGRNLAPSSSGAFSFVKPGISVRGDKCSVVLFRSSDLSGSSTRFGPGSYDHGSFTRKGAANDDVSSLIVSGGNDCKVTMYQHGDFKGWSATFEPGRYAMDLMTSRGAQNDDCSAIKVEETQPGNRRLMAQEPVNVTVVAGQRRLQSAMKVPDGWKVTTASSVICEDNFHTREIKNVYQYQHEQKENLNPFGFKLDLGKVTLSLSAESREFRQQNAESRKVMMQSTAECIDYVAEISDLKGNPPPTSANFKYTVGEIEEEKHWYRLFDLYGTHFPTKVVFGAKFGTSTLMKESSFKTVKQDSSSFSVGAEYTKQIEMQYKMGKAKAFGTVGVSYGEKKQEQQARDFASAFSETKEYSLGKKMPLGGAKEWVKLAEGEPMPARYGLVSICEHPAVASKKSDCDKYSKTYCANYLANADEEANCAEPDEPECTWDSDCLPYHHCSDQVCVEEPPCYAKIFQETWLNQYSKTLPLDKPVVHSEFGDGRFVVLSPKQIRSYWVSGGCKEVIFMDQDKCREDYSDNEVQSMRRDNDPTWNSKLKSDLSNDVCKLKLTAKSSWV